MIFQITYNKKDVTSDISNYVLSIEYTDKISGEADTINITVNNSDGRWLTSWYPKKGDYLKVTLSNVTGTLNCGTFQIDEILASGGRGGSIVQIRGISTGFTTAVRTKKSYAHEDKSLKEIADTVASALGLVIIGSVPEIRIKRVSQYKETDLAFLSRISRQYGCYFSIRDKQLIFIHHSEIEAKNAAAQLRFADLSGWEFQDTTHKTFTGARLRHHSPNSKEVITYFAADGTESIKGSTSDELALSGKVDNKEQAEAKAKAALHNHNTAGVTGNIQLRFNAAVVAGNNLKIAEGCAFDGIYTITESSHTVSRQGAATTSAILKRIKT